MANVSTTVNGTTRITGLSSGLDVDSIVSQLMTAERAKKADKLEQLKQKTEWTQTAYQDIISDIQDFSSKYFDTTASNNLLSSSTFIKYDVTSSSAAVSASYTSSAAAGSHTVTVSQLATKASRSSSTGLTKDVQGAQAADYSSLSGETLVMTVDGTAYDVDLSDVTDTDSLQTAIDDAVGSGKITVGTTDDGYLTFTAAASGVQKITVSASDDDSDGFEALGFSASGAITSNRISTSDTLADIADQLGSSTALSFDSDGQVEFKINGTTFTFDQDDKLSTVISTINKSSAGVTLKYDELNDKLTLSSNTTGAGTTLTASESSSTFLSGLLGTATAGTDAKMTIDGTELVRSSNTVSVDGMTYTLNKVTTSEVTVTADRDTSGVYDAIESFVDDYNTLISTINDLLDEDYDTDYPPLTDSQKEEMTDDEITNWETKAKVGLLSNDTSLKSLVSGLRTALIDSVKGQSLSLASIGITTGTYDEKGKLYIDEDTLTGAISTDPEGVQQLFTQQAASKTSAGKSLAGTTIVRSLSISDQSKRYKEEGVAYRIYDTLQKSISTIRDSSGNKGTLLEKAGISGDASEDDNTLGDLLEKYTDELDEENDRLDDYEDKLYTKYSTLESYISTMDSRLSALTSYTSSSS